MRSIIRPRSSCIVNRTEGRIARQEGAGVGGGQVEEDGARNPGVDQRHRHRNDGGGRSEGVQGGSGGGRWLVCTAE